MNTRVLVRILQVKLLTKRTSLGRSRLIRRRLHHTKRNELWRWPCFVLRPPSTTSLSGPDTWRKDGVPVISSFGVGIRRKGSPIFTSRDLVSVNDTLELIQSSTLVVPLLDPVGRRETQLFKTTQKPGSWTSCSREGEEWTYGYRHRLMVTRPSLLFRLYFWVVQLFRSSLRHWGSNGPKIDQKVHSVQCV